MKRRFFYVSNLIAISFLLVALYLNFVYKENNTISVAAAQRATSISDTVLVENSDAYLHQKKASQVQEENKNSFHQ